MSETYDINTFMKTQGDARVGMPDFDSFFKPKAKNLSYVRAPAPTTLQAEEDNTAFWNQMIAVCDLKNILPGKPGDILTAADRHSHLALSVNPPDDAAMDVTLELRPNQKELRDPAEMVHMDPPWLLGRLSVDWLRKQGATANLDRMTGYTGDKRFHHGGAVEALIAALPMLVSPYAFETKWHYMKARPEEYALQIALGQINVPEWVLDICPKLDPATMGQSGEARALRLSDGRLFTTYPEGAPGHPSYIAMHSAVAQTALVLSLMFDLSQEQAHQVALAQYNWSFGRTSAQVHFPEDNIQGLELGVRALEMELPTFAANFGVEISRDCVKKAAINWSDFDSNQ